MNKEYTGYLKGVAILLMVFLHLFSNLENDLSLDYLVSIGDVPLIYYLSRMCNPVPFFLILSGYGLYATYSKMGGVKPCKRVANLYLHLWIIYLLLLPLAFYVKPNMYPGSIVTFIKNATSWQCSYIGEQWFFLPYIVLMLVSKWVFQVFDKLDGYLCFLLGLVAYGGTSLMLKIYGEDTLAGNMFFYNIFLSFYMLFPFALGYLAKKYKWIEKLRETELFRLQGSFMVSIMLIMLCLVRCCIPSASVDSFYAIAFIVLFALLPVSKVPAWGFTYLGKHSMNIWLIHTWFSTRLFHNFIYDKIHYPILMYIGLIVVSLVVSHVVEWLYKPIGKYMNRIAC